MVQMDGEMFMSEGDMVLKRALDDASNLLAKTVDPSQLVDIIQKMNSTTLSSRHGYLKAKRCD